MESQDTPTDRASKRPTADEIDAALRAAGFDPTVALLYLEKG